MFPGIAIKFLRSGIHSANTVALRTSGKSEEFRDFFESPLSTHVAPDPKLDAIGKFNQGSGCRSMTGISDMCSYTQDGAQVRNLNFPWEVKFTSPSGMRVPPPDLSGDDKKTNAEYVRVLTSIPSGTHLYTVSAKASPSAKWVVIGKFVTRSKTTLSNYGDTQLFFRHQRMEE